MAFAKGSRTVTVRVLSLAVPLGVLLIGAALLPGREQTALGHGDGIHVGDFYFCDPTFQGGICDRTFPVGTEVAWEVFGSTHTITECDDTFTTCPPSGGFDLGIVSNGDSRFRVFNDVGVYEYRCNFHPSVMRGRVIVQAQTTATATPGAPSAPTPTAQPSPAGTEPTPAVSTVTANAPGQPGSARAPAAALGSAGAAAAVPVGGSGEPPAPRSVWHSLVFIMGAISSIGSGAIVLRMSYRR